MSGLTVENPVQTLMSIERGDEYTISKVINDDVYRRRCHSIRKELEGTKGLIRDGRGSVQAKWKLSIPADEFYALVMSGDPDAVAWERDKNDKQALNRLVQRFPYWRVS